MLFGQGLGGIQIFCACATVLTKVSDDALVALRSQEHAFAHSWQQVPLQRNITGVQGRAWELACDRHSELPRLYTLVAPHVAQ